jgi:hypothetical protein
MRAATRLPPSAELLRLYRFPDAFAGTVRR